MGKGDKKSRRGKIWRGSYGNTRPRKRNRKINQVIPKKQKAPVTAKAAEETAPAEVPVVKKPAKKAPAKKAAKKTEE